MKTFLTALAVGWFAVDGFSVSAQDLPRSDHYGDPLPKGAAARLGTVRLRQRHGVIGVAFTPDGRYLASAGMGDAIRLWDVKTGRQVRRFRGSARSSTFAVAFSPDGAKMASVGTWGLVQLWDVGTGKELFKTKYHKGENFGVAFSPIGTSFATAGSDGSVRLWDVATGKELLLLHAEQRGRKYSPVVFSPDGRLLATASASGRSRAVIQIWNLETGAAPTVIRNAHAAEAVSLAFMPNGKTLISSGSHLESKPNKQGELRSVNISEIRLWDVASGARLRELSADEELLGNCTIKLSRDGSILASAHYDKVVIWEMPAGKPLRVIGAGGGHYGDRTHGLAISPDGTLLAARAYDNKVRLWEIATGKPLFSQPNTHFDHVLSTDFSPDGKWVVTASKDGTVRLWDSSTARHIRLISRSTGWVRSVEFSPDGRTIVIGAETSDANDMPTFQGEVKICRAETGKVVQYFDMESRVVCASLSRNGKLLAAATGRGLGLEDEDPECKIHVWNLETRRKLYELGGHEAMIVGLAFTVDSKRLVSASVDGMLRHWELKRGEELGQKQNISIRSYHTTISANGQIAVQSGRARTENGVLSGKLLAWEFNGGSQRWKVTLAKKWPVKLALSRYGTTLASALRPLEHSDFENAIALWNVKEGRETMRFNLEDGSVRALALSRDDKRMVSGMARGDALVWNVTAPFKQQDAPR